MFQEKNTESLENLLKIKDLNEIKGLNDLKEIIVIGRFSYEGDHNDIVLYGFADSNNNINRRMLKLSNEKNNFNEESVRLSYTENSFPDFELVEPEYLAMRTVKDFVIAGNGMHTMGARITIEKNFPLHNGFSVEDFMLSFKNTNYKYEDIYGHELWTSSFKPDIYLTPRILGLLYSPFTPRDSFAILSVIRSGYGTSSNSSLFRVPLEENRGKAVSTIYGLNKKCVPFDVSLEGWNKQKESAEEFQKKITSSFFRAMGENAVGAASVMGYLDRVCIINRKDADFRLQQNN